ncbi:DUF3325 domain-containing protein [Pseudomonas sp. R5(2019)]|uniref:DUF3325 domain-containing protein n=1 Tax=Pseudomonas sp. R5(2019) TaxID=2697566 RepID=UPI003532146F
MPVPVPWTGTALQTALAAPSPPPALHRTLRIVGWLALAASFVYSIGGWGWAMGPVGWFGLISLAGLALVLLLPYAARLNQ